jgi:hypothetical protein
MSAPNALRYPFAYNKTTMQPPGGPSRKHVRMTGLFAITMLVVFLVSFAFAWLSGGYVGVDSGHNADRELAPVFALVATAVAAATWLGLTALGRIGGRRK